MIENPETLLTIIIAFLTVFSALVAMAIGWIITKKTDFFKNRCGSLPKKDCTKDTTCQICKLEGKTKDDCDKE